MVPGKRSGGGAAVLLLEPDVGGAVGVGVDRDRALGLCAVPLWTLGHVWRPLGMGAGTARCAPGVRACAGGVCAPRQWCGGVVPLGAERTICALVSLEHAVPEPGQCAP